MPFYYGPSLLEMLETPASDALERYDEPEAVVPTARRPRFEPIPAEGRLPPRTVEQIDRELSARIREWRSSTWRNLDEVKPDFTRTLVTAALLMQFANAVEGDEQRCVEKLVRAWVDCVFDDGTGMNDTDAIDALTTSEERSVVELFAEPKAEPYSSQVNHLRALAERMKAESEDTKAKLTKATEKYKEQAKRTRTLERQELKLREEVSEMERELNRRRNRLESLVEDAQDSEQRYKALLLQFVEYRNDLSALEEITQERQAIYEENERLLEISNDADRVMREQLAEMEERERSLGAKIMQLNKYVDTTETSETTNRARSTIKAKMMGEKGALMRQSIDQDLKLMDL